MRRAHTATHGYWENRLSPPTLWCCAVAEEIVPPPPAGDQMDTATDDHDLLPLSLFSHPLSPVGVRDGYFKGPPWPVERFLPQSPLGPLL